MNEGITSTTAAIETTSGSLAAPAPPTESHPEAANMLNSTSGGAVDKPKGDGLALGRVRRRSTSSRSSRSIMSRSNSSGRYNRRGRYRRSRLVFS